MYILIPCIKLPTTKLELSRIAPKASYMTQLEGTEAPRPRRQRSVATEVPSGWHYGSWVIIDLSYSFLIVG